MKENLNKYAQFIADKINEKVLSENYLSYLEKLSEYVYDITDNEIEIQYDV